MLVTCNTVENTLIVNACEYTIISLTSQERSKMHYQNLIDILIQYQDYEKRYSFIC